MENLEKQFSYLRSKGTRSTNALSGNNSGMGNDLGSTHSSMNGSLAGDSLEEIWFVVLDMKEKMDQVKSSFQSGSDEKYKELTTALQDKELELNRLMSQHDTKLREAKAESRSEIQELKRKHRVEAERLEADVDKLKKEKLDLLRKIRELEIEKGNAAINSQRALQLQDQVTSLQLELRLKEETRLMDQQAIIEFVQQTEQSQTSKANLEDKYRELKKKAMESRERVVKAFNMVISKLHRKKATDKELQDVFDKLPEDEYKIILSHCEDLKLPIKKR
jgi:chromosome segregation ATPase